MKLPRYQLATLLAKRSLNLSSTADFSNEIAAYLLAERRTAELDSLLRDIMQYRIDYQGIVEVRAHSAHALKPAVLHSIERHLKDLYPGAKQIIIDEINDPSMVGGVRLELANQQLDLTVRAKLNRFKQLTTAGRN